MPNLRGPSEKRRKLYANTIKSIFIYGAPIWSDEFCKSRKLKQQIRRIERILAIRVIAGYRTVSADAALLLARFPPMCIAADYWKKVYTRVNDHKKEGLWTKAIEDEIKENEKIILIRQWQLMLRRNDVAGLRTCTAIAPILPQWLERKWGETTYRMTQLLTGHGCFNTYLYRIGKAESPVCTYCDMEDSTKHHIMECTKWNIERETLKVTTGEDLQLLTIVRKLCEREEAWLAFSQFAESILTVKEEDERIRQRRQADDSEETDD